MDHLGFPGGSDGKESACSVRDLGSIPGSGRSPGEEHGNALQYSCLENPMDRGAWQATVHGVAKSQTQLNHWHTYMDHFFPNVAAKSLQSCPTLCDPIDGSPPGSAVPGILQARIVEWVAISFSKTWKWKVKGKSLSRVRLLATPWTAAYQAPPSMGFSRQEYWSGVPLPSPSPMLESDKAEKLIPTKSRTSGKHARLVLLFVSPVETSWLELPVLPFVSGLADFLGMA